jgi:hypothetical protein
MRNEVMGNESVTTKVSVAKMVVKSNSKVFIWEAD